MTLIFFVTHTAIVREYQEFFLMKIAPLLDPVEEFEIQNHPIFGVEGTPPGPNGRSHTKKIKFGTLLKSKVQLSKNFICFRFNLNAYT